MASRLSARIGTFRQLEILLTVYQEQSIKHASAVLHLTQPTVSMQLKKLADAVGLTLYDQVGKRIVFTEAGEKLVNAAQDILDRMNHLDMELSELRGLKTGTLKISVVTTAKYFLPHVLGPFCQRYPGIDVEFNVGNRQQIIQRLEQGKDDFFVFSNVPERHNIESIDFLDNPLVAIAPAKHPLAREKNISLDRLAQQPFLVREQGSGTRFATEQFLKTHNITLNTRMTIESNEAIKHSVMSGLGFAILSEHTLAFGESQGLVKLQVQHFPIRSRWYLVRIKSKQLSPVANTFLDYLEAEGRDYLKNELRLD
jgi:DNA-binding transcriptional LysR family regulator